MLLYSFPTLNRGIARQTEVMSGIVPDAPIVSEDRACGSPARSRQRSFLMRGRRKRSPNSGKARMDPPPTDIALNRPLRSPQERRAIAGCRCRPAGTGEALLRACSQQRWSRVRGSSIRTFIATHPLAALILWQVSTEWLRKRRFARVPPLWCPGRRRVRRQGAGEVDLLPD
jgi:hypothetical protein